MNVKFKWKTKLFSFNYLVVPEKFRIFASEIKDNILIT